ncbi:hypothetical protein [Cobetia sp. L2A1]|uniref:hypothetical protein n=1 Tax=Cobetia sp. L2A1 TaxID=2686360 RepID=UPI00131E66B8|nr:hypothetical protein [Cobetia sp. L2A1]
MRKIPARYQFPVTMALMLPIMLLGMPLLILSRSIPAEGSLLNAWLRYLAEGLPLALPLALVAIILVRLLVTRVLMAPAGLPVAQLDDTGHEARSSGVLVSERPAAEVPSAQAPMSAVSGATEH